MSFRMTLHYDNTAKFGRPHLWVWYEDSHSPDDLAPTGADPFGLVFDVELKRAKFNFKFKDGLGVLGPWEAPSLERTFRHYAASNGALLNEIWCRGDKAFVYPVEPRRPETLSAAEFLEPLAVKPGIYLPSTGGVSGLGATLLNDGRVLFGLYHPNAARVYLMGSFNNWQHPGQNAPDPSKLIEMKLYRGYFDYPNTWLVVHPCAAGDEYKFFVLGGVPSDKSDCSGMSPIPTRGSSVPTSTSTTRASWMRRLSTGATVIGPRPTSPISSCTS
jgi:hypothetical protein